jgi:hypothetical protein
MPRNHTLSVLGSIGLWLTASSASAMVCLGWLASAMPGSLAFKLSDKTGHLIGNVALSWVCLSFTLFALPLGVTIAVLRRSRLHGVLLRISGIASALAVLACYWEWRTGDVFDFLIASLAIPTIALMYLHAGNRWVVKRWMGVSVLILYFGMFAWVFKRFVVLPEVLLVPASGLISSLVWAHDVKQPLKA